MSLSNRITSEVSAWGQSLRAYLSGDFEEGIRVANTVVAANLLDAESHYYTAVLLCLNGDPDGCIRNLHRAVDGGYFNHQGMARDPLLNSVRGTDEFDEVMEKAREKHERFKAKYFLEQGR